MSTEYVLLHDEKSSARILLDNKETAKLKKVDGARYELSNGTHNWILSKRVDGEIRPFSIAVFEADGEDSNLEVLKIKDHLFLYHGNFYMVGGIPESRPPREHLSGSKFICKLTNFPFTHHDHIDPETRNRLKKHRGEVVGEIFGLGSRGFHVKLENELNEIKLPLTASTYLIYSSI